MQNLGDVGDNWDGGGVKNRSQKMSYLKSPSPTPICLFTIQLLWGYDDD